MNRRITLLLLFLSLCPLHTAAKATTFTGGYAPEKILEAVSFETAPSYDRTDIEDLAALGLFSMVGTTYDPSVTVTASTALKWVYRTQNRESEAFFAGGDLTLREKLGLTSYDVTTYDDGFFMLAYEGQLITQEQFSSVFSDDSLLSKESPVQVQTFITWLAKAFGLTPSSQTTSLKLMPYFSYLSAECIPYYAALAETGKMSDILKLSPTAHLTQGIGAQILMDFRSYLFPKYGLSEYTGTVSSITITNKSGVITRTITVSNDTDTYELVVRSGVNGNSIGEFAVLGKGEPDISGALRTGDQVVFYAKDSSIRFLRVTESSPTSGEDYCETLVYHGMLYLYDSSTNTMVISGAEQYFSSRSPATLSIPVSEDVVIYAGGKTVPLSQINASHLDKAAYFYVRPSVWGGIGRIETIIIEE